MGYLLPMVVGQYCDKNINDIIMKSRFIITEEEKNRILNMHKKENRLKEGVEIELSTITPNVEYFVANPKGKIFVDDIGSVISSVNGNDVSDEEDSMNSDELIRGGEYDYQYEPLMKTMRNPNGEPVVKLFQGGKEVNYFFPMK